MVEANDIEAYNAIIASGPSRWNISLALSKTCSKIDGKQSKSLESPPYAPLIVELFEKTKASATALPEEVRNELNIARFRK